MLPHPCDLESSEEDRPAEDSTAAASSDCKQAGQKDEEEEEPSAASLDCSPPARKAVADIRTAARHHCLALEVQALRGPTRGGYIWVGGIPP